MSEFFDQYKHPNWQKKRLEALEAAEFECENCGSKDGQLHVHHRAYIKGLKVWEYENGQLSVLCGDCHKNAHEKINELRALLSHLDHSSIDQVIGFVKVLVVDGSFEVRNYGEAMGVAGHFCVNAETIIQLIDKDHKTSVQSIESRLPKSGVKNA